MDLGSHGGAVAEDYGAWLAARAGSGLLLVEQRRASSILSLETWASEKARLVLVEYDRPREAIGLARLQIGASDQITFVDADCQLLLRLSGILLHHDLVLVVGSVGRVVGGSVIEEVRGLATIADWRPLGIADVSVGLVVGRA